MMESRIDEVPECLNYFRWLYIRVMSHHVLVNFGVADEQEYSAIQVVLLCKCKHKNCIKIKILQYKDSWLCVDACAYDQKWRLMVSSLIQGKKQSSYLVMA